MLDLKIAESGETTCGSLIGEASGDGGKVVSSTSVLPACADAILDVLEEELRDFRQGLRSQIEALVRGSQGALQACGAEVIKGSPCPIGCSSESPRLGKLEVEESQHDGGTPRCAKRSSSPSAEARRLPCFFSSCLEAHHSDNEEILL